LNLPEFLNDHEDLLDLFFAPCGLAPPANLQAATYHCRAPRRKPWTSTEFLGPSSQAPIPWSGRSPWWYRWHSVQSLRAPPTASPPSVREGEWHMRQLATPGTSTSLCVVEACGLAVPSVSKA